MDVARIPNSDQGLASEYPLPEELSKVKRFVDGFHPEATRRIPKIGTVAGGLGTYWPQFPGLLAQLQDSAWYVSGRFQKMNAEVVDVGFISEAQDGGIAAERLRLADCDLIVMFLSTYLTSSMVLPIAQRSGAAD